MSLIWKLAWVLAAPKGTMLSTTTALASTSDQANGAEGVAVNMACKGIVV
jgi:hypothetical protein